MAAVGVIILVDRPCHNGEDLEIILRGFAGGHDEREHCDDDDDNHANGVTLITFPERHQIVACRHDYWKSGLSAK